MNDKTNQEIRQFLLDSLTEMNYSIEDVDDDTALGPAGADLESLVAGRTRRAGGGPVRGQVRRRRGENARRDDRRRVLAAVAQAPVRPPPRRRLSVAAAANPRPDVRGHARRRTATAQAGLTSPERIDSLELAWLVHQLEQHYGVTLDLDDEDLARMSTVSGRLDVLTELKVERVRDDQRP